MLGNIYITKEALDTVAEKVINACSENKFLNDSAILSIIKEVQQDLSDKYNLENICDRRGIEYIEDFVIDHKQGAAKPSFFAPRALARPG